MKCPSCHHADTSVMDSRVTDEGLAIRRRRVCDRCGFRFSTIEEVEILNLTVVKRDGRREPYSREKLEGGLRKALEKRPITVQTFKRLVGQIERDIQLRGRAEITSQDIGAIVIKRLQRIDQIAYIRFASVYRQFQDVETFRQELNRLLRKRRRRPSPARPKPQKQS
ncbi:MAG: transcriptional repressor NrdR [Candidatus Kerfeldbacteria bacterium]|nr:transcriptional repressor NrdR [Candidatus Kerfeldbacteria bacterium]